MKKKLSLIALFTLVVGAMILSGCNKSADSTTPPAADTNAPAAPK